MNTAFAKRKAITRQRLALGLTCVLALLFLSPASADVPKPFIAKAKGEKCVADTDFMRRNHMDMLMHKRDDTVHKGIRKAQYSLTGCLNCHAYVDNRPVSIKDKKHFCRSCHEYAAVKVDCFDCHGSKPGDTTTKAGSEQ